MFDQWESMLPYLIIALVGIILVVLLVIRFRRKLLPQSLRNRLPWAFLAVAAVSVVLVVGVVLWQIQATLVSQSGEILVSLAESNKDRLAEQLGVKMNQLQELRQNTNMGMLIAYSQKDLDELSPQEREAFLLDQEERWHSEEFRRRTIYFAPVSIELQKMLGYDLFQYSQVLVTDIYGGLSGVAGDEPEMFYFVNEDWWQAAWNDGEGELYIGTPYVAEDGQTVIVEIAMPIYADENAESTSSPYHGVLLAKLRLNDLTVFSSALSSDDTTELALVDNVTGMWLFSSNQKDKVGGQTPALVKDNINQNDVSWGIDPDETGQNVIHSHARLRPSAEQPYLEQFDFTIVVQQPASQVLQGINNFLPPLGLGGIAALVIAGAIGYFIARQISRPIISLSNIAATMAEGQLDQTAPETGPTELQTLARSFNSMTGRLQQTLLGLEQQVEARTERLETVATLGEHLSSILNVEDLLNEVVTQIQDSFGYYHAHIYLMDDERQNLVVAAGTGSAGAEMKAQGHSISFDAPTSLVARSARLGEIVRVDNVRETSDWLPNPLLPETYSEMAVPIALEGKVAGVLDVQQNRIAGLDEGDAALLRSLANQVAVAINNARLFEEVETALAETREIQRRYVEQAWDAKSVARRSAGRVQFSLGESTTLSEVVLAKARKQAATQIGPTVIAIDEHTEAMPAEQLKEEEEPEVAVDPADMHHVLVAPIALGETVIGNFQLHEVDPNRQWSEGDLALIDAVIDQVAQTAENLRLLDVTQERANREQLISRISDKLRRAADMETLMKVATSEISRALNPTRTFIRFDTHADNGPKNNGESATADGNGKSDDVEVSHVEDDPVTVEEHHLEE